MLARKTTTTQIYMCTQISCIMRKKRGVTNIIQTLYSYVRESVSQFRLLTANI